ncbi:MAG: FkbM family methyltransferase [Ruminococcaceae bacterium]|nr:FkbM family methyltransferase [Oscillospiraceae bacterium]
MERELWSYLKETTKPIVLYGMGNGADKIIKTLDFYGIEYKGVFASDGFVRNKLFHGHKISSYKELKNQFGDMIILLCFGSSLPNVIDNIKKIASEQELYAPEVPVIGGGLFTMEYYKQNLDKFEFVRSKFADEISIKTFDNILKYKLSGKIEYLFDCETDQNNPYQTFLRLENENFIDLGAYNGDTALDFSNRCPDYRQITAIEPDKKTFKKLQANTQNLKNITLINACVSNKCGALPFSAKGGRNSSISSEGDMLQCITVDSLNTNATFIKMDVEGEEIGAIEGAKQTILNYKPKMLISAYHRTDDFIKIPQAVLNIRDDYKIYMRHFKYLPAWDTNFYFI